jgi:SAM-dependent methyltransferase
MANPLRRAVHPFTPYLRAALYAGHGRDCPCCGRSFRRFRPTGDPIRPDTACPFCNSVERHRLLTLAVQQEPQLVAGRVLHFAPEAALGSLLRDRAAEYVTTDLSAETDVTADITELPFPDDRWDAIVCSHVLEHVPDDAAAMRELRRVLAPDGHAIVIVPRVAGTATDEDPTVTDPLERLHRFGQQDHVRTYGDDLEDRLRSAGFTEQRQISGAGFSAEDAQRYRLIPQNAGADDVLLVCR